MEERNWNSQCSTIKNTKQCISLEESLWGDWVTKEWDYKAVKAIGWEEAKINTIATVIV